MKDQNDDRLPNEAGRTLVRVARETVRAEIERRPPQLPEIPYELERPGGAFVTLKRGAQLRGCIGTLESSNPLWKTVEQVARQAATVDYRFDPVQPGELSAIRIEVSVLSPLERIPDPKDPDRISIGRDGLCIRYKQHSSVLLPQVASEHDWTPVEFLEHLCRKAGLRSDCWQLPETDLFRFSAEVFDEQSAGMEY